MSRIWIDELDPLPEDPGFELRLDISGRATRGDIKTRYADWYSNHEQKMTLEERQHAQYAYDHLIPPASIAPRIESVPAEHHLHRVFLTRQYYDYTYPVFAALRLYYVEKHKGEGFHEARHMKALTTFKRGKAAKFIAQRYQLSSDDDVFEGKFGDTYPGPPPPRPENWPCIDHVGAQHMLAEREVSTIELVSSDDYCELDIRVAEVTGVVRPAFASSVASAVEQRQGRKASIKLIRRASSSISNPTATGPPKPTRQENFDLGNVQGFKRLLSDDIADGEQNQTVEQKPRPTKKAQQVNKVIKRRLREAEKRIAHAEKR